MLELSCIQRVLCTAVLHISAVLILTLFASLCCSCGCWVSTYKRKKQIQTYYIRLSITFLLRRCKIRLYSPVYDARSGPWPAGNKTYSLFVFTDVLLELWTQSSNRNIMFPKLHCPLQKKKFQFFQLQASHIVMYPMASLLLSCSVYTRDDQTRWTLEPHVISRSSTDVHWMA
jgi:hypothetical protein